GRQRAALGDDLAERLSRHELHDHERVSAVAAFVEHRDDVRVYDRRRAARLVGETRAERVVRVVAEELYRHIAIELLVARAPHLARAALVARLAEPIPLRRPLHR